MVTLVIACIALALSAAALVVSCEGRRRKTKRAEWMRPAEALRPGASNPVEGGEGPPATRLTVPDSRFTVADLERERAG